MTNSDCSTEVTESFLLVYRNLVFDNGWCLQFVTEVVTFWNCYTKYVLCVCECTNHVFERVAQKAVFISVLTASTLYCTVLFHTQITTFMVLVIKCIQLAGSKCVFILQSMSI